MRALAPGATMHIFSLSHKGCRGLLDPQYLEHLSQRQP